MHFNFEFEQIVTSKKTHKKLANEYDVNYSTLQLLSSYLRVSNTFEY